jgi:hypothetical protein
VDDVVAGVDDVVISSTLRRILVKALGALLLKQRLLISRQVVVVLYTPLFSSNSSNVLF